MKNYLDCIEVCLTSIICCPCIACYSGFSYCLNDSFCLLEICQKVFENDLITYSVIGKKWSLDNNWLTISKEKKEALAKRLFNIINNQISESNINIENITNDYYGKEFVVTQLRWFLKMSIIYYYDKIENELWNPNNDNFEILKLKKKKLIGWEKPILSEIKGKEFVNKFLYIDNLNIKYNIDTLKDDEVETLKLKYEKILNKIIDTDINYISIFEKSNCYLQQMNEERARNKILAEERLGDYE